MTDIAPPTRRYDYERDGRAIYRESFATIRREVTLDHLPEGVHRAAVRVAHAAGDVGVIDEIAGSTDVGEAALAALRAGAPVITDSHMLAAGVTRSRLPADNDVICTLREPQVPAVVTVRHRRTPRARVGGR